MPESPLSCPFCGAFPEVRTLHNASGQTDKHAVVCDHESCFIHPQTRWLATAEIAVFQWNHREGN